MAFAHIVYTFGLGLVLGIVSCSINLNAIVDLDPIDTERARQAYDQGNQLMGQGDFEGAANRYTDAIAADPNLTYAYNNRAIALCRTDRWESAVDDLERATSAAANPGDRRLFLYNLGNVHLLRGFYPQAAEAFERVIELDATDQEAKINLSVAYVHMDELQRAEQLLLDVLATSPDHLQALANLGTVYDAQGQVESAFTYYRRALDVDPQHVGTLRNIAMLEIREGLIPRAIEHLDAFVALAPEWMNIARYRSTLNELRQ